MSYMNSQVEQIEVIIPTPDGQMPGFLFTEAKDGCKPAVIVLMEAFGLIPHIRDVAARIANEGYVVLAPDLYYRELPNNKFGYDQVEQARAAINRYVKSIKSVEEDIRAALAYVKSRSDVNPDRVGITGFCLGGSLSFFTACTLPNEIAAAASFYGIVTDEWIDAAMNITVPVYLFFGGVDPYIPRDRVQQIESRLQDLRKEYTLKIYPDADHGFFCHERSSYNRSAAEDSWHELTQFFHTHLQKSVF